MVSDLNNHSKESTFTLDSINNLSLDASADLVKKVLNEAPFNPELLDLKRLCLLLPLIDKELIYRKYVEYMLENDEPFHLKTINLHDLRFSYKKVIESSSVDTKLSLLLGKRDSLGSNVVIEFLLNISPLWTCNNVKIPTLDEMKNVNSNSVIIDMMCVILVNRRGESTGIGILDYILGKWDYHFEKGIPSDKCLRVYDEFMNVVIDGYIEPSGYIGDYSSQFKKDKCVDDLNKKESLPYYNKLVNELGSFVHSIVSVWK